MTQTKLQISVDVDPAQLTPERIKQIGDDIIADLAREAAGARGDIEYSRSSHTKVHAKW